MKPARYLRAAAVALAITGLIVPKSFAGEAVPAPLKIQDVAIANGTLHGQVLSVQGVAVANSVVAMQNQQGEIKQTKTDAQGRFAFTGLKSGMYAVATQQGAGVYRAWTHNAPPAATPGVLIVNDGTTVRGGIPGLGGIGLGPAIIVGSAVAIGIAAATAGS